ncbi:Hypothetical predicted protein [Paramuricea clavata]|uniref:Uncharacterized protein n=1 Tax=Paramuricea clavata TaxID=317549 RepID=A0A6S7G7Z9_PARCT|nr:Hypothetical predicted protein [Paramuricea clavata]
MLQCTECEMWRLLFTKNKLKPAQKTQLTNVLGDDVEYTCGATLEEFEWPENFPTVFIRDHTCYDKIEKLYYSCDYEDICIYCSKDSNLVEIEDNVFYPQCQECINKGRNKIA